jgi:6-phosphogluconate dehydrogenase
MANEKFRIGMIGLGTMGRNLLLNMADHGFAVAGYDRDAAKLSLLEEEGAGKPVKSFATIESFLSVLESPRVIILLVPAGKIVDAVLDELSPLLNKDDIIIDGGNSHFADTTARVKKLDEIGLHFFGMGVSGGEEGARRGPSLMPGGNVSAYLYVKPVLEAIAAKVNGEPCVAYIGPGASGHFVKMVHNGIEYAMMQLIADSYELMRRGLKLNNADIQKIFASWNSGELQSYLLEITADIFAYRQPDGTFLVDLIKDEAKSKGTGKWTTQISTDLELPIPTIDLAVVMRDISKYKSLRVETAGIFGQSGETITDWNAETFVAGLKEAYHFSMICIYAQGIHLLSRASEIYGYQLKLDEISRIWRGGCIIRSSFLQVIREAFENNAALQHLFLDAGVQTLLVRTQPAARTLVSQAIAVGISVPAFASTISYFDALRSGELPSNLIQAQRDYFGAHTYELKGKEGVFHTEWVTP